MSDVGQMNLAETMIRWFETTQKQITAKSNVDTSFTLSFCALSVAPMKTYCIATALLVDKDFRLPTVALLRAVAEFFIKVVWCVNTDDENELRKRVHRWEKTSAQKKLTLFSSLLESRGILSTEEVKRLEQIRDETEQDLRANKCSAMPPVTGSPSLFEENANLFGADVSSVLYRQFCSAIHVDTSILRGLICRKGPDLMVCDDIVESLDDIRRRCLNFAYMFLVIIYRKIGLDIGPIEKDYKVKIGCNGKRQ